MVLVGGGELLARAVFLFLDFILRDLCVFCGGLGFAESGGRRDAAAAAAFSLFEFRIFERRAMIEDKRSQIERTWTEQRQTSERRQNREAMLPNKYFVNLEHAGSRFQN